ncbi:MAG: family 20 glycosylhydrolase [Fimbriimonas sp.]|nr:family 20 glycosylhydrolase [Fimbriimonas sp.]
MFGSVLLAVTLMQGARSPLPQMPIRGIHLSAPETSQIPIFTKFVRDAFPKEGVNTLVLEFDYRFKFQKHPEVADEGAYSVDQVRQIASACKDAHVRLIPQINLLGHQSWAEDTEKLLRAHPEFDETRGKYPKNKGIYCRSYCPNAPGIHKVIFDCIDELADACGADAFHCGMDEVFILADPDCPNCKGKTAAQCFIGEVKALHDHLKATGRQMWMWGDRFLDGRTNGLGEWEASTNGTWPTITEAPKDIVISDWHYEHAEPTPALFAINGFSVVASPWRNSSLAVQQVGLIEAIRKGANRQIANHAAGVLHTTWCDAIAFSKAYYGDKSQNRSVEETVQCFKDLFKAVRAAVAADEKKN